MSDEFSVAARVLLVRLVRARGIMRWVVADARVWIEFQRWPTEEVETGTLDELLKWGFIELREGDPQGRGNLYKASEAGEKWVSDVSVSW